MKKLLVLIAAAIFVAGSVMPVMAQDKAEWGFYGSARMWTAYQWKDAKTPAGFFGTPGILGYDDDELVWELQGNSRIGANVRFGDVGGRFEYGHVDTTNNVSLRLMYGTWNFGPGTLLVGQDYTPLFFPISDQCGFIGGDCGLIFWGTVYTGRIPQLKLIMGGLQVALLKPNLVQKLPAGAFPLGTDTDAVIPEIEAAYTFNLGPAALMLGGAYKTYDVRGITAGGIETDFSVKSWLLNAAARTNFGPFYANASLAYGKNIGDYGLTADIPAFLKGAEFDVATNSIEDADNILGALILGFRMTDAIKFEGGVGYLYGKKDFGGIEEKLTVMTYYLQMAWSPAKNVFIVPEIGWIEYGDFKETGQPDVDLGTSKYAGIKWQINF
jgi:hypothetical protein